VFGRAWKIGSIGGIDIRVDTSWLILAVLIVYSGWVQFNSFADMGSGEALGLAVIWAVLLFASVLVHELAHALVARSRGLEVLGITLFLFGGATSTRLDRGPGDEFLVTVVGPLTSAVFGVLLWVLPAATGILGTPFGDMVRRTGWWNLILAGFNLLPGFPLDGGRVLRSIVWRVTGDPDRATEIAARVGQVVAAGMIAVGLVLALRNELFAGVWLVILASMLFQGARAAAGQPRVRRALAGGTVGDAMGPPPDLVPAGITLSEVLDRYLRGHEDESFPVVEDGRLVGLLTFQSASRVGRDDPLRPVRDAMLPVPETRITRPDERLDALLERIGDGRDAVVIEDGRVVGSISIADMNRWLNNRFVRRDAPPPGPAAHDTPPRPDVP